MKKSFYMPFTAAPWKQSETYREVLPRSPELAGIIRCFWGSDRPYRKGEDNSGMKLVVPDTCADIIYQVDYTENRITGIFCGVNDASFVDHDSAPAGHQISVFAVRFYAWSAYLFSEDSLKSTANVCSEVPARFDWFDRMLRQQLFERDSLAERSRLAEEMFLGKMFGTGKMPGGSQSLVTGKSFGGSQSLVTGKSPGIRRNPTVDYAIEQILFRKGVLSAEELARECFISGRQLERLFHEYIGLTPKKLCNLVRYQCLWNEILKNPRFCTLDAVCKYGYTDQSHLMREFKRYHTMDIQTALKYARCNVGNIQSLSGSP